MPYTLKVYLFNDAFHIYDGKRSQNSTLPRTFHIKLTRQSKYGVSLLNSLFFPNLFFLVVIFTSWKEKPAIIIPAGHSWPSFELAIKSNWWSLHQCAKLKHMCRRQAELQQRCKIEHLIMALIRESHITEITCYRLKKTANHSFKLWPLNYFRFPFH